MVGDIIEINEQKIRNQCSTYNLMSLITHHYSGLSTELINVS
jgi:hypothetical protein